MFRRKTSKTRELALCLQPPTTMPVEIFLLDFKGTLKEPEPIVASQWRSLKKIQFNSRNLRKKNLEDGRFLRWGEISMYQSVKISSEF